jgi:hypothetical protein
MARVREKGGTRLHRGEMTAFAFDAQLLLDATLLGYQAHQGLRLMGIEVIGDEDPSGLWIRLDGLSNVGGEIGLRAGGSNTGRHDLSGRHLQIGDQAQGAMPLVFEFLALNMTGQHGQGRMKTLEGLDTGHLIGARHMGALRSKRWGGFIDLTDGADLFGQLGGVVGRWSQPVPLEMRLQRAHLLKNAPRYVEKSARRCRV